MNEMVERIVNAMVDADHGNEPELPDYRAMARAAIEAMREPTARMWLAAETHNPADPWYEPDIAWPRMIDAALAKTPA